MNQEVSKLSFLQSSLHLYSALAILEPEDYVRSKTVWNKKIFQRFSSASIDYICLNRVSGVFYMHITEKNRGKKIQKFLTAGFFV